MKRVLLSSYDHVVNDDPVQISDLCRFGSNGVIIPLVQQAIRILIQERLTPEAIAKARQSKEVRY